jgi:hypothetical protein
MTHRVLSPEEVKQLNDYGTGLTYKEIREDE